jgi:hypothetical protein
MAESAAIKEWDEPEAPPVATEAGGDDVAVAEPAEAPAAEADAPAAPDDSTSPDAGDPLDRLLAQWDEEQKAGNGAAVSGDDDLVRLLDEANQQASREQEFQAAQQRYASESAQSSLELARREQENAELRGTVHQLQQAIAQEQARQFQARQLEDFKRLAADEQSKLSDVPDIADSHVETFLLAESRRDSELVRAFDARYYTGPNPLERAQLERAIMAHGENLARTALQIADPAQRRLAEQHIHAELRRLYENTFPDPATYRANAAKYVHKALDHMHREARKPRLDPDRSADYFAVAQAVRGASSGKPPPDPPVNLGRMTAGEFAKHTLEKYGF